VSFQSQHFTGGVFQLGAQHLASVPGPPSRLKVRSARIPTFSVRREPSYSGWWGSLRVLCSTAKRISVPGGALLQNVMFGRRYFRGSSLSLSFVLHCVAVFLLIFVPTVLLIDAPELESVPNRIETIYYLPPRHKDKVEPRVAAAERKAPPPAQEKTPSKGAFAVARLAHPETARKANQTAAPPVLRVTSQMKLPDLILAAPLDTPKMPSFRYNPSASTPTRQARNVAAVPAPSLTPADQIPAGLAVLSTSTKQPILPIAVGPTIGSRNGGGGGGGSVEAPNIDGGSVSGGAGSVLFVVTGPSLPSGAGGSGGGNGSGNGTVSGSPTGTGSSDFSVSSSSHGGSPGGTSVGAAGGGGNGAGGVGLLKSDSILSMVYAIPPSFAFRKNALIVSAGPIGGGGLGVYGALHCGKVDTVFLSMPGKNWTMEYCPQGGATADSSQLGSTVVHMGQGIVPPQAESRFDFQRLPVPESKAHKLIILKGTLRDDGSVDEVQVYQSILPLMDEAARVALSRWKFKPALRQGAPIAVQILVGIPVDGGVSRSTP